jgi:hypothetical protein
MDSAKVAEAVGDPRQVDAANPLLLRATQAAILCGTSVRTWRTWDAIRLTLDVYTHVDLHDCAAAITSLPAPPHCNRDSSAILKPRSIA